ncbi:MAG: RNA methyltransferase [Cyclobacteriaceae bacterium]|nr:RNA methyltransferase [Cyclobacteriaceae bacterium]
MDRHDHLVLQHLEQFVSDHKKEFVARVLEQRTRQVTVVLEDIYQSQNASAVIRTCECMGLQDVHIVENTAKYHFNIRVLKGANKWIDLIRYREKHENNTETCFSRLRKNGYKILVADPAPDGISIHDVDCSSEKLALVFGNELRGVSAYALEKGDQKVRVPMYGFTESLNISVSVAISLNSLMLKLRQQGAFRGLSQEEQEVIKLNWYRKIVKRSEILEREYLRTID